MVSRLEREGALDTPATQIDAVAAAVTSGPRESLLRGDWLGHALHPVLTDFPVGCWLSAGLLDLFGGRSTRRAAQRLVGAGLLFTPPTIASGLADYRELDQQQMRRVAVVHAGGNALAGVLYLSSWNSRRRGKHARGVFMSSLGSLCVWGTSYLGGHLSYSRGAGQGERGQQSVIDLTSGHEPSTHHDTSHIGSTAASPRYEVGSLDDDELEYYYRTVLRLKNNGESRSIQGIMRELGESGPQSELRTVDALQILVQRGRLQLVPVTTEYSALGEEINETNETHWYDPVEPSFETPPTSNQPLLRDQPTS